MWQRKSLLADNLRRHSHVRQNPLLRKSNGATVSPHVSASEMLQAVIAGKMTQEEFANLVAGQIEAARANGPSPRAIRFEVSDNPGVAFRDGS